MTRSLGHITAAAALAVLVLLAAAGSAGATHVQCGDTIVQSVTLDSDVVCATAGATGLTVGASNVTLDLNRHAIRGAGSGTGIFSEVTDAAPSYSGVTIRGGSVEGFATGISAKLSSSSVRRVSVNASGSGIFLRGQGNAVNRDAVTLGGDQSDGDGITIIGSDAHVSHNTVSGDALFGLMTQGDNPRVWLNTVTNCIRATGIFVFLYDTGALVERNRLIGCDTGISAWGTNARVRHNVASHGCRGMFVLDASAIVAQNKTNRNCHTGIESNEPGTTLTRNVANDNGRYGIRAAPGTVDGGGNRARRNGTADCVNVSCR